LVCIVGHRGARGLWPENTVEGFRRAIAFGVDAIEFDVALTADEVPVVHHDPALNGDIARGPDGNWLLGRTALIRALKAADLSRFDVGRLRPGSDYAMRFAAQTPIDGARIPTLAEVLTISPIARFAIELKLFPDHREWTAPVEVMVEAVLAAIDAACAASRCIVQSFDWRAPRFIRRHRPDIATAWLTEPATEDAARLWWDGSAPGDFAGSVPRAVAAEGGAIWSPEHGALTAGQVAEAHELGLLVVPWTVNERGAVDRLVAAGVDGLITDRPDICIAPSAAMQRDDSADPH
jgi:glycerophosphoryl diester phosphodiesterase